MNLEVMYSKKSDDWKTPAELYNALSNSGYLDPCPYQAKEDGLIKNYHGNKLFINPPFSKMIDWVQYAIFQRYIWDNKVALLIPARTDTKYFHKLLEYTPSIYFIKGRLHYNESEKNAPFPSLFIVLDGKNRYYSITLEKLIELIKENKI